MTYKSQGNILSETVRHHGNKIILSDHRSAQWVMTPVSMYFLWKQGSWLLWATVHAFTGSIPRLLRTVAKPIEVSGLPFVTKSDAASSAAIIEAEK